MIFEADKYYRIDRAISLWDARLHPDFDSIAVPAGTLVRCDRFVRRSHGRYAVVRATIPDKGHVDLLIRVSENGNGPSGITPITSPLHLLADVDQAGQL